MQSIGTNCPIFHGEPESIVNRIEGATARPFVRRIFNEELNSFGTEEKAEEEERQERERLVDAREWIDPRNYYCWAKSGGKKAAGGGPNFPRVITR